MRKLLLHLLANYYLAVRACQTVPFFPQGDAVRLARKADQTQDPNLANVPVRRPS